METESKWSMTIRTTKLPRPGFRASLRLLRGIVLPLPDLHALVSLHVLTSSIDALHRCVLAIAYSTVLPEATFLFLRHQGLVAEAPGSA